MHYYPSINSPFKVRIAICFDHFRITLPPLLKTTSSFTISISSKWTILCAAFFCTFFDSCFPFSCFPPFFSVIWNRIALVFKSVCVISRVAIRVAFASVLDRIRVCSIANIKGGGVFRRSKSLGTFASS